MFRMLIDKGKSLIAWGRARPFRTLILFLLIESFVFVFLVIILVWLAFLR